LKASGTEGADDRQVSGVLEEAVKCAVVIPFLDALGVSASAMQFERSFEILLGRSAAIIGRDRPGDVLRGRLDVLVRNDDGDNLFVMELKRADEALTEEDANQGISYARQLRKMAPFVLVTNGIEARLYDTLKWAEIMAEAVPARYADWKSGRALASVDDLQIRYEALKYFLGYSIQNVKLFCETQRGIRMSSLRDNKGNHDKKYLPDVYIPRTGVRQLVTAFLTDSSPAFVLAGNSGCGKTNEMCALAEELAGEHLVLFFNGPELYGTLAQTLTDELNWHFSDQLPLPKICERLAIIGERLRGRVVLFFDAVDEAAIQNTPRELSDLTTHFLAWGGKIKLIASLKTDLWADYSRILGSPSALAQHCFKSSSDQDARAAAAAPQDVNAEIGSRKTPPSFVMSEFDADEREVAVDRYGRAFRLQGTLSGEMLEAVADPFMLRVVAEAYADGRADVPRTADQWELLRVYLIKKLEKLGTTENQQLGRAALVCVARALASAPHSAWAAHDDSGDYAGLLRRDLSMPTHAVDEDALRRELSGLGAAVVLTDLIAHGFLFAVHDTDDRRRIGFQYDRVRDYVVAALLYQFDKLANAEFESILPKCVADPVSRSALHFYMRNAKQDHRAVFVAAWPGQWIESFRSEYERIRNAFGEALRARIEPCTRGHVGVAYSVSESGEWALALFEAPNSEQRVIHRSDSANLREIPIPGGATVRPQRVRGGWEWGLFLGDPAEAAARLIWPDLEQIVRDGGLDESISEVVTLEKALSIIARNRSQLEFETTWAGSSPLIRQMSIDLFPIDFADLRRRIHSWLGAEFYRKQFADRQVENARDQARSGGEIITTITIHYPPEVLDEGRKRGAKEAAEGKRFPPPWQSPPAALAILDELLDMLERNSPSIREHYLPAPDLDDDGRDYVEVAYSDDRMKAFLSAFFCHALREYKRIVKANFGALARRLPTYAGNPVLAAIEYTRPSDVDRDPIGGGGLGWALASSEGVATERAEVHIGNEDSPFLKDAGRLTGKVRTTLGDLPSVDMHFTHFSSVIRPWREIPLTWPRGSSEGSELTPVRCWIYNRIKDDMRDLGPTDLLIAASTAVQRAPSV